MHSVFEAEGFEFGSVFLASSVEIALSSAAVCLQLTHSDPNLNRVCMRTFIPTVSPSAHGCFDPKTTSVPVSTLKQTYLS